MSDLLEVHKLEAGYGKLTILHDISLTIQPNLFTTILGPNGSGKSTLLKSIFGLTTITHGSVRFRGEELVGVPTNKIGRRGIAYVPQRGNVFTSMTIQENLLLALGKRDKDTREKLLQETYDLFPIIAKRKSQRTGQLSGGERQMIAIAMAWLRQPTLMLLDEPSAGLAPVIANEVFSTLKTLRQQDITLVVVEQNARRVLEWCDYAYVLREGEVAFSGTAAACLADADTVKNYLGVGVGKRLGAIREKRRTQSDEAVE